jgi:hypothetical protein
MVPEGNMRTSMVYLLCGAAGIAAIGLATPASADDLHSVVRTLNAVLNPEDAQRLEEQSRRNGRVEEERYWHNYRLGLEQHGDRGGSAAPYGAAHSARIGPDEAGRLEQEAHRNGRWQDERYWHEYRVGLEGPRPDFRGGPDRAGPDRIGSDRIGSDRIGPDQAARLEATARGQGRWEEARYWAAYRAGLDGRR